MDVINDKFIIGSVLDWASYTRQATLSYRRYQLRNK